MTEFETKLLEVLGEIEHHLAFMADKLDYMTENSNSLGLADISEKLYNIAVVLDDK